MCPALVLVCLVCFKKAVKMHLCFDQLWERQLVTHSPMKRLCLCSISGWFQSLFAGDNATFHGQSDVYKAVRSVPDLQLTSNCKKEHLRMRSRS